MWLVQLAEKATEDSSVWSGDAFVGGIMTLVGIIITTFGAVFLKKFDKQEKRQAELEKGQATIHESIRFNGGDTDSLSDRLDRIGSRIDSRMDRMDGRLDAVAKRVDDVADGQARLGDKLREHMGEHPAPPSAPSSWAV